MIRNLSLGLVAAVAFAFSPFTSRASADWQAYYDQLAKLDSARDKVVDSQTAIGDKLRAAELKRRENYLDSLDKIRSMRQPYYWGVYPGYYGGYSRGYVPYYSYPSYPSPAYSPGGGR